MASQLLLTQKKQLVKQKADFEKDRRKMLFKDQLAYRQENFTQSPSSGAISRIWSDREKWVNHKSNDNPKGKRIRGTMFERKIAAPLSKMMIERLGKRCRALWISSCAE